jgi:hypothetical protein
MDTYALTTAIDHLVTDEWQDTMAECADEDLAYPAVATLRAIAVMQGPDHPDPLSDAQVTELLARIEQEGNRLLGREA